MPSDPFDLRACAIAAVTFVDLIVTRTLARLVCGEKVRDTLGFRKV